MSLRSLLLLLLVTMTACVSTNATMLDLTRPPRPAVAPDLVRIYRTADQVKGRFEEIALLHSSGETGMSNEQQMLTSMRKKAGELGANAIILEGIKEASSIAVVAATVLNTSTERKGRAVAIFVFPDSSARQ